MTKKTLISLGTAAALLLVLAGAAFAQTNFSLTPYAPAAAAISALKNLTPNSDGPFLDPEKKHPWLAASEIVSICFGVWLFDRYVLNLDYSHISWASIKRNFTLGFFWDHDTLSLDFFGHPYQGSTFFNTARSLGMTFWESIPFTAGGYLLWGFIFENDRAAYNDLIMDVMGGTFLGETMYRLSSQVLDDTARGGRRIWKEILAFLINPRRGANRVYQGEAWRVRDENKQMREPTWGTVSIGADITSRNFGLTDALGGGNGNLSFSYGDIASPTSSSRAPFSLIIWDSEIRRSGKRAYYDVEGFAFIAGKQQEMANGQQHLFGLFEHYEYLKTEVFRMAGTALTGGVMSRFPFGKGMSVKTSVQVGLQFGGSDNPYVHFGDRDFNFGWGGIGKLETWLDFKGFGRLDLRLRHSQLFSVDFRTHEQFESKDYLTHFLARYDLPVTAGLGLRLEYSAYERHHDFEYHHSQTQKWSQLGASLVWMF